MYTISKLAKEFGLSRSTMIYYDSIELLQPSNRTATDYRLYSESDRQKLSTICLLRETGLPLKEIKAIIDSEESDSSKILKKRLLDLNLDINALRRQQETTIKLLGETSMHKHARTLTKERWVQILRASGLDDDGMQRWHSEFERSAPEAHQDFLESLGLQETEIKIIRGIS